MATGDNAQRSPGEEHEDFRIRVAREKRLRMRARLQDAAIDVFGAASPAKSPTIDDVIGAADVSRGTFYKYYSSLEDLLWEIGTRVANDILATYKTLFSKPRSPSVNLLCGPLLSMVHAGMDPAKAAIAARVDFVEYFSRQNNLRNIVVSALVNAAGEGLISYPSLEAATDFVVGCTLEGMRRASRQREAREEYIQQMTAMIGAGLQMDETLCSESIAESWGIILERGPSLNWWSPEKLKRTASD